MHLPKPFALVLLLPLILPALSPAAPAAAPAKVAVPSSDARRLDPEAERRSFKVADGFEVTLFASDPMIAKPIQMTFDARGRMWVVSSSIYPMIKPGQPAEDKVIILEDTKHAGRADKATVFAEGLLIPTGIALGDGGAYVANSTEIVHLKDSSGGDHADTRRVVLSGFGTEDTHHIVHTFRWGPDGRLYFNQSIYIHSHIETPWGTARLGGGGIWRFRPESMKLDVAAFGGWNPWGHAWDAFGQDYSTDGAFGEGAYFLVPGAFYPGSPLSNHYLTGLNPGSPKYCGLEILGGRHLPDAYQGDLLTNDFRAHRVCRFKLSDSGAGVSSRQMPDFIVSGDVDFRPIDIKVGPDGAIYIADWCNPIINHGEVDFRDPRRDHVHGRIWRVAARGRPAVKPPVLAGLATPALLEHLKSPEAWTRDQARLILRERGHEDGGQAVAAALGAWVKGLGEGPAADHARLEALWAYETVDVIEPALLHALLAAKDGHARAAAVTVLSHWMNQIDDAPSLLASAIEDDFPRVRLAAARALAQIRRPESVVLAMKAATKGTDRFLDYALWLTANDLKDVWLPAFQAGHLAGWADPKQLTFALQAVQSPDALKTLMAQLQSGQLSAEAKGDVFDLIGAVGGPGDVAALFEQAAVANADSALRLRALQGVERAARARNVRAASLDADALKALAASPEEAVAVAALRVAGAYPSAGARDEWEALVKGQAGGGAGPGSRPPTFAVQVAAARALAALGPREAAALRRVGDSARDGPAGEGTRAAAAIGLCAFDLKDAAARAAGVLARVGTGRAGAGAEAIVPAVFGAFLDREGGADALAAAIHSVKLPPDAAKLALRSLQASGRMEAELTNTLRDAAGIGGQTRQLTPDEMRTWVEEVARQGDPARGEKLFRSAGLGCYQCHAIAGAGAQVAPDLRTLGASAPVDYIIDSVLYPNKAVKEGFNAIQVSTKKGEVYSGLVAREDEKELVLKDNLHDEIIIAKADVKRRKDIGSIMPTGLADPLTHGEFIDLIRFLTELGKPGPYALGSTTVVRRWRVLDPVPEAVAANAATAAPAGVDGAGDPLPVPEGRPGLNWSPAYSLTSGELPPDAWAAAPGKPIAFARCQLDVTAAGAVGLQLNSPDGLSLWVDGRPVAPAARLTLDLPRGTHALTFQVRTDRRKEGLRVEVIDVPGSPGRAQPVTGK